MTPQAAGKAIGPLERHLGVRLSSAALTRRRHCARSLLVPLLGGRVTARMGFYICYAQRKNLPGRVRRFIDYAADRLEGGAAFHLAPAELRSLSRRTVAQDA